MQNLLQDLNLWMIRVGSSSLNFNQIQTTFLIGYVQNFRAQQVANMYNPLYQILYYIYTEMYENKCFTQGF